MTHSAQRVTVPYFSQVSVTEHAVLRLWERVLPPGAGTVRDWAAARAYIRQELRGFYVIEEPQRDAATGTLWQVCVCLGCQIVVATDGHGRHAVVTVYPLDGKWARLPVARRGAYGGAATGA